MPASPERLSSAIPALPSNTWAWGQEPLPPKLAGPAVGRRVEAKKTLMKETGATSTASPARRSQYIKLRKKSVPTHAMNEIAAGRSVSGGGGSSLWSTEKAATWITAPSSSSPTDARSRRGSRSAIPTQATRPATR